jgi:hypothetical protein
VHQAYHQEHHHHHHQQQQQQRHPQQQQQQQRGNAQHHPGQQPLYCCPQHWQPQQQFQELRWSGHVMLHQTWPLLQALPEHNL